MRYDLNDIYIKIYYESTSEFEEVRDICLSDNNWLRDNYTKENLIIEQHNGYGVVFQASTGKPMVMGGVFNNGRFPGNVARMINREYTFLDFRMTRKDMTDGFRVTCSLIDALIRVNNYDTYFISMQNRPNRPKKGYWDIWCHHMSIASDNQWKLGEGYLQTCNANVQKCWQNFVYRELKEDSYNQWNPKLINHDEWLLLEEGK